MMLVCACWRCRFPSYLHVEDFKSCSGKYSQVQLISKLVRKLSSMPGDNQCYDKTNIPNMYSQGLNSVRVSGSPTPTRPALGFPQTVLPHVQVELLYVKAQNFDNFITPSCILTIVKHLCAHYCCFQCNKAIWNSLTKIPVAMVIDHGGGTGRGATATIHCEILYSE